MSMNLPSNDRNYVGAAGSTDTNEATRGAELPVAGMTAAPLLFREWNMLSVARFFNPEFGTRLPN